jgi:hypothetical protein
MAALAAAAIIPAVFGAALVFLSNDGCSRGTFACELAAYVVTSMSVLVAAFFTLGAVGVVLTRASAQTSQPLWPAALWASPAWTLALCIGVAAMNNPFHYTTTQWMDWWTAISVAVLVWALSVAIALRKGRKSGLLAIASGPIAIGFAWTPFEWATGMLVW